jgi:hypothetical protein
LVHDFDLAEGELKSPRENCLDEFARFEPYGAHDMQQHRDAKMSFRLAKANVRYATRATSAATASKAFRQRKIVS